MRVLRRSCIHLAFATLASTAVQASQEGILNLGTFQLSSPGIDQSGPVLVSGTRQGAVLTTLCVQAFEQTKCLSSEQLSQIEATVVNGVQLSYEAGYRETGGRTVYIFLSKGFIVGRREGIIVSVSEFGPIKAEDAHRN